MHMSSDDVEQKDKGGRPKEGIKFGQHKNEFGWDPTGKKEIDQAFSIKNQNTTFSPDSRAEKKIKSETTESRHSILKYLKNKSPEILLESLKSNKLTQNDLDVGTMLDENNIL